MKHASLAAEPRTILGKKVARLRRTGKLPANIYGHNVPSRAITLDAHDFGLLYRHLLPTTIIDLRVDGQAHPVLMDRATADPRSGRLIHVEFKQVNLLEKVHATVPVVGVGTPEPVSAGDALLLQSLDVVTVSALPDELPPSIEVDLSVLVDLHSAIHVRDLSYDRSKIEVLTPADDLVFKLTGAQLREIIEEEEAAAAAEEAAAVEAAASEAPAEEETAAAE